MTDFASSLDLAAELVKQFRTDRAAYHTPEYKEIHALRVQCLAHHGLGKHQ